MILDSHLLHQPTTNRTAPNQPAPHKLVILESSAKVSGIQQTTLDMAANLNRARWRPLVVCPEEGDLPVRCRAAGIPVMILPRPPMLSTSFWVGNKSKLPNPFAWIWNFAAIFVAASGVRIFLRNERPDVVMTKGLICHFYGGLASKKLGVPCVWLVEDFVSRRFGGVYRIVFGEFARRLPTRIMAIGNSVLDQVPAAARNRASLVTNGIDTRLFRPGLDGAGTREEFGIPPGAVLIGNVSRITPWKGQHHLIEAFASVARTNQMAHLVLVGAPLFGGADYERRLRNRVAELGLDRRVFFTGHRNDIPALLAAMDIFAYTAVEKDAWPLSLLQGMACGLPVAAFGIEGIREPMGTGEQAAHLVPVGDEKRLADSLALLVSDVNLRQSMGRASRARAEQACSLSARVARIEGILGELVRTPV